MSRPPHRDPLLFLLVAAGGTGGTAARAAIAQWLPHEGGVPLATLLVNLVGAFLLGLLLETLLRRGPETTRHRALRLTLGTGVLGGFTTYSVLALELHEQLLAREIWLCIGYAFGTIGLGLVTCVLGIATAARLGGPAAGGGDKPEGSGAG